MEELRGRKMETCSTTWMLSMAMRGVKRWCSSTNMRITGKVVDGLRLCD